MTTSANRIEEIFQDARHLQDDALEMLTQGRRNAAEKSWGATKRATDALILARTGEEPERTPETGAGLRTLESLDPRIRSAHLRRRYYVRQAELHGQCFYNGLCDPLEDTDRLVRRTSAYIDDAQRLAEGDAP
jgi:hypothetical protein